MSRPPRVAWRPPPSTIYHRIHGGHDDGQTRTAACGAILDCPQYRSLEGLPRQAEAAGRRPCRRPRCHLTPREP